MLVKIGAAIIELTPSIDREESADFGVSFAAGRRGARKVIACFCSVQIAAVHAIFAVAMLMMQADRGRHWENIF